MNNRFAIVMAGTLLSAGAMAQSTVRGTVVSQDDGQPIVGATIRVEDTNTGTVTDIDGRFSVAVPTNKKLRIEYVGMESKTVAAKDGITISLIPSEKDLDEVLVVAYGKQKRSAFTGSAGVVSADELKDRVVSNVTNAMSGQVAGVQVLNSNGQPGSDATIRVRGIGSISSSNDPLIILDGVPYDGNISSINPTDIASLTVLKDAASNAIYGARGANGVVLVTTKQGNSKEAKVTFDAKWGTNSRAIPQYDVISGAGEYYETMFKALYNSKAYHGSSAADAYAYANSTLFDTANGGLGYQVFTVPDGEPHRNKLQAQP
ncbi:TonB-dependent receptor plug domain-containing protein [uncultured Prevotella sp.]|uniref:TonB-dependent receptor plug domain-containing protein n=1 Tax=uncultured Prevotella sp. TaxID=159272 RepID=UPI003448DAA6